MADQIPGSQQTASAETGGQQAGNAESLSSVIAGAAGAKPAENPGTGGNAKGDGTAGSGSAGTAKLAPWTEQLPEDLRGNPDYAGKLAQFAKVGDMAKAYLDLAGKDAGAAVPGKDATAEEAAAFWEKAGKPKDAAGYSFAGEEAAKPFAEIAHAANLTETQAQAVYARMKALGEQQLEAAKKQQVAAFAETETKLKEEFGSRYPEKIEYLKRGLQAAGGPVGTLLQQAGIAGHPDIVRAFILFGEMTSESGGAKGSGAARLKSIMEGGGFAYN
ncbi:MAG: hypothetical protein LBT87_00980 [Treponema sp.]|jgi:hypothetical protein|nr:hypothetical protein [Treponema sp.]